MEKIFKTIEEQIDILKSKGLIIEDEYEAGRTLLRENYFFISGYRHLFINTTADHNFIVGTTFNEIYALFKFDRHFRNILFRNLLMIENNLKSVTSYQLSKKYGYKEKEYLKYPTGLTNADEAYKNFQAGDVHFVDQNGDGVINEADKVVIGDPNPSIYGNIHTSLSYKRLTLDVNFKYSLGNDVYNYQRSKLESGNNFYNQTTAVVNRWTYEGQQTDMPKACSTLSEDWRNNERFSDRWIEDGSYLKLKNIRLTYDIPVSATWLQGIKIWGEANDVFTLTKYLGTDPEISAANNILYQGIDNGMLPLTRSFNIGVSINL